MPKLIKDGKFTENTWVLVEADTPLEEVLKLKAKQILLPANLWAENQQALQQLDAETGLWFDSSQNPEAFSADLTEFPVLALEFPLFKDGRAYSYAAILRQQLGFKGDLRAIGEVLRDQLSYMLSCGFSSFMVADDADEETFLNGFQDFSDNYQSTVTKPTPLFRRRL